MPSPVRPSRLCANAPPPDDLAPPCCTLHGRHTHRGVAVPTRDCSDQAIEVRQAFDDKLQADSLSRLANLPKKGHTHRYRFDQAGELRNMWRVRHECERITE